MSAILPFDSSALISQYFTCYQLAWIHAEDPFHEKKKQVFALAEKSVRIGWTFCDGFKNVRKRLRFKKRDYLFVTRDWPPTISILPANATSPGPVPSPRTLTPSARPPSALPSSWRTA